MDRRQIMKKRIIFVILFLCFTKVCYGGESTFSASADEQDADRTRCQYDIKDTKLLKGTLVTKSDRKFLKFTQRPVNGIVCSYYESGKLLVETPYIDGKQEGIKKVYYENGNLKVEIPYKDGKQEGIEKVYYEIGELLAEIPYKDGKTDGIEKIYDERGKLQAEISYKDGKQEGIREIYYETTVKVWE